MIDHIVLFRFRDDAAPAAVTAALAAFATLPHAIPGVQDFRSGGNVSPEQLAHGYDHGWIMRFADAAARDHYLQHPAHLEFVAMVQPLLAQALVFDLAVSL